MLGEFIRNILIPLEKDEWIIIKTDVNFYTLRLGGFKKRRIESKDLLHYKALNEINYIHKKVTKLYTDDQWLYIFLENDFIIANGWGEINEDGEITQGIYFKHKKEYDANFFEEDFFELKVDENGNSIIIPPTSDG